MHTMALPQKVLPGLRSQHQKLWIREFDKSKEKLIKTEAMVWFFEPVRATEECKECSYIYISSLQCQETI